MTESYCGVFTHETWSLKAWWSTYQRRWLIQVEHNLPERGGWIRAWLMSDPDHLMVCDTLDEAHSVISAFLSHPEWTRCRELSGVV